MNLRKFGSLTGESSGQTYVYTPDVIEQRIAEIVREACASGTCGHREHKEKIYRRVEACLAAS